MKLQYFIIENLMPSKIYEAMKAALPKMDEVPYRTRSHKDLFCEDKLFLEMVDREPAWLHFKETVYSSQSFWRFVMRRFQVEQFRMEAHHFVPICVEDRGGQILTEPNQILYPRLDIGYGLEGYGGKDGTGGGGPHIDFPQRIVSMVYYFSNQKDFEGGEFELWNADGPPLTLYRRIPLRENMAIFVLQDEHGYHSVNPITKCTDPRIAAYIALSSTKSIWNR